MHGYENLPKPDRSTSTGNRCRRLFRMRQTLSLFCAAGVLLFALWISISGCRSKDTPTGSNDDPPGSWRMYLVAPDTVHAVGNDTFKVRLFNPYGAMPEGVILHQQNYISTDSVTGTTTTVADTVHTPWGSYTPIMYWGTGRGEAYDLITSVAVVSAETVATAHVGFKVVRTE